MNRIFLAQCCLKPQRQHYIGFLLCNVVQGVLRQYCKGLPKYVWDNTTQENYLCNVRPEQTDTVLSVNSRCNVVSTMLGQHCIRILSSQYCLNTSKARLHKKTTCAMLAESAQTCFGRKTGISFKWLFCSVLARKFNTCLWENNE